eukprot:TRINITY_DN8442_c0_g1_i1.p1 TRINITY_DN8442_c0_g1~~TRINITY_DN8442_c0_g1_i1.p1  ORF type:complete len:326 (+),score=70.16 TRINITY_DN8442_c0_g1_i1:97-1074(+)
MSCKTMNKGGGTTSVAVQEVLSEATDASSGKAGITAEAATESSTASTMHLYAIAVVLLAMVPQVDLLPGTVSFFLAQAALWGIASGVICEARRRSWTEAGMPDGPAWDPDWKESCPAWAFEASFLIQLCNIPFLIATGAYCFSSLENFHKSYTDYLPAYAPEEMWLDHVIFASLFGFMIRDFVVHRNRPDPLLAAHHVGVCFLMIAFGFLATPGIRALSFTTPVVELGTSSYCAWVVWKKRQAYIWLMTISNIVMMGAATLCIGGARPVTGLNIFLYLIGVGLTVGRQFVLMAELREHAEKQSARIAAGKPQEEAAVPPAAVQGS